MIQLSNIILMFAANSPSSCISKIDNEYFFMLIRQLYQHDIRLSNPYGYSYLLCVFELGGSGGDSLSFIVNFVRKMPSSSKICDMVNNSIHTATSVHETRAVQLTSNPFRDFSFYGLTLHGYHIKYWRGANRKNHSITGQFNISGRIETFGANSYEEAIEYVVFKIREHQAYIRERRRRKREQRIQA